TRDAGGPPGGTARSAALCPPVAQQAGTRVVAGGIPALPRRSHAHRPHRERRSNLTPIDGTPRRAGQTEWRSLRVRYYADNKDALILDAVRPLFREFAGKIEQPYFVRHWRQGPHLRLKFRCSSTEWNNTVLPAATGSLTEFLRRHPSTAVLDEVAELRRHQRMADQEGE